MMCRRVCILSLVFSFTILCLCSCSKSTDKVKLKEPAPVSSTKQDSAVTSNYDLVSIKVGSISVKVELAQTQKELEQGLMFREYLPENQGMLFVFQYPQVLSFWMRNTFIPLDIAFIDPKGKIVSIQQMQPLNDKRHYVSPSPVPYALEMNQGWFEHNKVSVGEYVEF